jgi:DNA-binding beta-propeller fold protein YncE
MAPSAKSKSALLYVSSVVDNAVDVYSYPQGQLVGTLTGFSDPYGLCSDKAGDVFVVNDGASTIVEYEHGGTNAIATLSDANEYPEGCSVDPTNGNLAVTNFSSSTGNGSVAIYTDAKGSPQLYSDTAIVNERFCGYDARGNLFVDGATANDGFQLAELKKGKTVFKNINLAETIEWPGGVQWDGKYVAVGDTDTGKIYRVTEKGAVKGTVSLSGVSYVDQFWIRGKSVAVPSQDGGNVGLFAYPAGGSPSETIDVTEPFGATIST